MSDTAKLHTIPVLRICSRGGTEANLEILRGDLLPDGIPITLYAIIPAPPSALTDLAGTA